MVGTGPNRGEFALIQTESAISFHCTIRSPLGVVFYQSNINFPRNTVYRSADYSCPINKPRSSIIWKVTYHICSKIKQLRSTRIKYSTSFYLHNQKSALNGAYHGFSWCAPPLSANHWVRTKWVRMTANQTDANHGKPVITRNEVWLIFILCLCISFVEQT